MLEVLADRCYLRHGCKSPFRESGFAGQAKANLHPLAFYTIEVTSPGSQRLTETRTRCRRYLAKSHCHGRLFDAPALSLVFECVPSRRRAAIRGSRRASFKKRCNRKALFVLTRIEPVIMTIRRPILGETGTKP